MGWLVVAVWCYGIGMGAMVAMFILGMRHGRQVCEEKQPDLTALFIERLDRENEARLADTTQHEKSPQ